MVTMNVVKGDFSWDETKSLNGFFEDVPIRKKGEIRVAGLKAQALTDALDHTKCIGSEVDKKGKGTASVEVKVEGNARGGQKSK